MTTTDLFTKEEILGLFEYAITYFEQGGKDQSVVTYRRLLKLTRDHLENNYEPTFLLLVNEDGHIKDAGKKGSDTARRLVGWYMDFRRQGIGRDIAMEEATSRVYDRVLGYTHSGIAASGEMSLERELGEEAVLEDVINSLGIDERSNEWD